MENKTLISISLKQILIFIFILIITILIIFGINKYFNANSKEASITPDKALVNINKNIQNFSFEFLKLENNKKNMVYSPLSIKYALNMLNEGASGNTKAQIENLIKNLELTNYENIDKTLSLANSIYIRNNFSNHVKPTFINTLTDRYNAEVKYDAFRNADSVNEWIENKTLGIIKNMVPNDLVQNPDTMMLLINALAIDMGWAYEFDTSNTYLEDFYLDNKEILSVQTMHKTITSDIASYYKNQNLTVLTMDLKKYNDTQLEFMAIMPNENLQNYIKDFTIDELANIIKNLKLASDTQGGIKVSIPKFSYEYDLNLKNNLITLGITDAFDKDVANFTNISEDKQLYVSDALHKANIEFKENGIKAAAATVFTVQNLSSVIELSKPLEIKINKPFLYLIKDKNTNEVWFVGTMYKPVFE